MDTTAVIVVAILVVAILVLAVLFRRGSFKAGMKGPLGTSLDVEGKGEGGPAESAEGARGTTSQSAGERSIQVGRDAQGTFITGDDNRTARARGDPGDKDRR